jgi:hypothetical protein
MAYIYISSDNLVTLDALTDAETEALVNDATVVISLFNQTTLSPDAAAAVDKGGGEVGIPVTDHGLVAGDYIRIEGSQNYNDEYAVEAGTTTNEIVITETYAAETFLGMEKIYVGVKNGTNLSMSAAGSGGKYTAILPDTLERMIEYSQSAVTYGGTTTTTGLFYLFIEAIKDTAKMTKRIALQATYDS